MIPAEQLPDNWASLMCCGRCFFIKFVKSVRRLPKENSIDNRYLDHPIGANFHRYTGEMSYS